MLLQQFLALLVYLLLFLRLRHLICSKKIFFPPVMERFTIIYNRKSSDQKQELLSSSQEFTNTTEELVLLDINCGTGANFQFYLLGCRVICTDPDFEKFIFRKIAENQYLQTEILW
ncbi:unnamed protein product [Natator depressus]